MPTVDHTAERGPAQDEITWAGLTSTDDGSPYEPNNTRPIAASVHFTGTSPSAVLEGSNTGSDYVTLKDIAGNDINSAGSAAMFDFSTCAKFLRVRNVSGTTTATLIARG